MVEMKLKAVNLKQLVAFLERVESPENIVAIKRISIQENKKEEGTLDVIMQVISLVKTDENGAG
jgi:general secretion pathway protein M